MTTHTFTYHVQGMHCKACEVLLQSELPKVPGVNRVKADLTRKQVEVVADSKVNPERLATDLTAVVHAHGYTLTREPQKDAKKWNEILVAFAMASLIGAIFFLLQRLGLANWITGDTVSYPLAFGIGVIASISSCMAVVGGLLLSVSATWSKQRAAAHTPEITPHALFHAARLVGFFILGGVLGLVGTWFTLNPFISIALNIFIGFTMLILGLNLLDIFDWSKKLQFHLPKILTKQVWTNTLGARTAPLFLGILTFFLPCGFTQSMQIYSLTTGGFLQGGLTMLVFALGTLPMLALISFSSFKFAQTRYAGVFFKTAGLLVIAFAIINLLNGLVLTGIIPPLFNI